MGVEGQGIRAVIMRRQKQYVIQRFDRDETTRNNDGILIPEKEELQYALLHHQPVTDEMLNGPEGQRLKSGKLGWALSEEVISNENKITIWGNIYVVNDLAAFESHSEFLLIRSGGQNNRAE
jgi:hypothetical protein